MMERVRKMLLNRNTVTILGVLAGVIVLWVIYSMVLSSAISPTSVPVAAEDLTASTQITSDDIEWVDINSGAISGASVITNASQLIGYYVNNGTSIPAGGMFYSSQVVAKEDLVERDLETIPEGYRIYWLSVDNTTTYANSIYPGDKIDLWLYASIDGVIVYEEFITSIDVLSVKDGSGNNVFDTAIPGTPAWLAFAVPTEMYEYFQKIANLSGMQLYPVPKNSMYTEEGAEVEYANEQLLIYIDSLTLQLSSTTSSETSTDESEDTTTATDDSPVVEE